MVNCITKKIQSFHNNDKGAASVVVSVLIIGLLFTFLSYIQSNQIPDWTEEREAEHMDKVADQFSQLKFAVDVLSTIDKPNNKITTDITLGIKEIPLPFLQSGKSYGFLKILDDECKVNVTDQTSNLNSYSLGSIQYSSRNTEYVDMDFIYEAGGIVINQKLGNIMYINPYCDITFVSNVEITYDTVNFIEVIGKKYSTGYGKSPIQLEYVRKNSSTISDVDTIDITSKYTKSWHNFFNNTLISSGLSYGSSNDYIIIENDNEISVDFNDALSVELTIRIIDINIQIGPGWIIK